MNNWKRKGGGPRSSGGFHRLWSGLLMLLVLLTVLSTTAFAVWDGQGDSGDSGASSVTGDYKLPYSDEKNILGYRFTVIDGATGKKLGHCADIDRKKHGLGTMYRSYWTGKTSHPELYAAYLADQESVVIQGLNSKTDDPYVFLDTSLPSTPTEMEDKLTEAKAREIAENYCDAIGFDFASDYLIVEPIFMASLQGDYYAMTMAEYAVYQSDLYGWTGLGESDSGVSGTYRYNIMRHTSAVWGRYLYAVWKWEGLLTEYVPPSALKEDAKGTPSVLLGSSTRFNTAENILEFQVGMLNFHI